jgi:hypothetical protein
MRSRVKGVFVVLTLMLSVLTWSGCSKQSQPSGNAASKTQSQYSGKAVQSQYSGKNAGKNTGKAQPPPSDEDIIKAIDDSGVMKRDDGSLTVIPPARVVEKAKLNKDGSWSVKVKFIVKYKMQNGKTTPPAETTTSFRIFAVKDTTGKTVLKAQLGV